ncbi:HTH domain-containing protein [Helicobacter sp. 23-1045]
MTFLELAEAVLKKAEMPLNYREMWESAKNMGLDKELGSDGKTPEASLSAQLFTNIKEKSDSKFYNPSKRPTTFWLKSRANEIIGKETQIEQQNQATQEKELKSKEKGFLEIDLHPLLVKFLFESEKFNLFCKTINANKSKSTKAGLNEWIHPDIVGIHFPFDDYQNNTLDLLRNISKSSYKIYSFEIKRFINSANLKECYFQAVSNSSFANEGYLVAYEIKDDEEVRNELSRLNASFGIGVVELKDEKVLFNARTRELDIETLDMLVQKNGDFREFIENVNKDIATNDPERIARGKYDEIFSDEKIKAHKAKCNIVE